MSTAATVNADFAARLYDRLAKAEPEWNLFLSPFSIQVALAMTAAGAKGETRKVLSLLIGAPESVAEQNRQYAAALKAIVGGQERHVQLAIANALWGQQGIRFNPEYLKAVADFYDGAFNEVNFRSSPDQAVTTINGWIDSKTAGKINELVKRDLVGSDTRLILTNAIYFKGKWDSEFAKSDTWDEDWHGVHGVQKVPMMQQRRGFLYCEKDEFQALDLPYQGEQLSMLIVLPKEMDGLAALESRWAAANAFPQVTDSLALEETVIVSLPRFKIATEFNLKPALSDMGAALAFSDNADFSGIGAEPLKISEVVHKAFIDVNEEGTEAAAATGVVMRKSAASVLHQPKVFRADHPFLFFIRHRTTNAVLFSGRVLEPSLV